MICGQAPVQAKGSNGGGVADERHAHDKPIVRGRANAPRRDAEQDHHESYRHRRRRRRRLSRPHLKNATANGQAMRRCLLLLGAKTWKEGPRRGRVTEKARAGGNDNYKKPILMACSRASSFNAFWPFSGRLFPFWTTRNRRCDASIIGKKIPRTEIISVKGRPATACF